MAGVMAELRNVLLVQETYSGRGASSRGFVPSIDFFFFVGDTTKVMDTRYQVHHYCNVMYW